jgi:uncharacterized protein
VDDNHPIRRAVVARLLAALRETSVVLLHGARETGKTTVARWLADGPHPARYFSLDDALVLGAIRRDPAGFLAGIDGPMVLDDIQQAPWLFLPLQAAVDRQPRRGRFLLIASSNLFRLPNLSESLASRMEVVTLWPFSEAEITGASATFLDALFLPSPPRFSQPDVDFPSRLLRGGYPPAVEHTDAHQRGAWFGSYLLTRVERDLRDLANREGLSALRRMLAIMAARTSALLNFAELARSVAIPQTTLKRYFALLEATFLAQLVPAWSGDVGKRLIKVPKLFLNDTGLAAYLLGVSAERLAEETAVRGALAENFVAMELCKQAGWKQLPPHVFHFRTAAGQEVDFVIENAAGLLAGIEVRAKATVTARDFSGLRALAEIAGRRFRRGIVLYTGNSAVAFGSDLMALPISALWEPQEA